MMVISIRAAAVLAAVGVLVACSSSSSGSASYPTCQGGTGATGAGSAACSSCVEGSCGSQLSAVESSCSPYLACIQGCQCSDVSCLSGCLSKRDSACQNADGPFATCLGQSCSSQCTMAQPSDGG